MKKFFKIHVTKGTTLYRNFSHILSYNLYEFYNITRSKLVNTRSKFC